MKAGWRQQSSSRRRAKGDFAHQGGSGCGRAKDSDASSPAPGQGCKGEKRFCNAHGPSRHRAHQGIVEGLVEPPLVDLMLVILPPARRPASQAAPWSGLDEHPRGGDKGTSQSAICQIVRQLEAGMG